MLSKDEIDYIKRIPANKVVRIFAYDPHSSKTAQNIINSIKDVYPLLEIRYMGASALNISGQNDLDIYAFSNPEEFINYLPGLIKLFGEPLHKHKTFIEWSFEKNGFNTQFYLTQKNSPTMQRQIKVFEILENNSDLLKEYEELKESLNGKSFKKYQERKYEFYHKILAKIYRKYSQQDVNLS